MLYQGDAHHYRSIIKRKQRAQRVRGSLLIALSIALMFYAIPGFAVSVFDFNDHAGADASAAAEGQEDASNAAIMSETVGPAMLADEAAVDSAKKRAEAMKVVTSAQSTMVTAKAAPADAEAEQPAVSVLPAVIAFVSSMVCAILGIRMISHSRQMLGRRITAEYGSALRAC